MTFNFIHLLLVFAYLGTATSAIYCLLVVIAAVRFRRWRLLAEVNATPFAPAVSLLKPLHGAEPGLARNIESFFTQSYAGPYEILFCARHENDEGLRLARDIASRYPQVNSRIITCGEPQFLNAKMYSLAVMTQAATHDLLLISDADVRVDPTYIERCVQELATPGIELAFCLYLGAVDQGGLFLKLDALGKSVEMSSGVLVADMLSGTDFALGPTIILRREAFAEAGGFEDLGSYHAEDFVLGNRLANQGRGVTIATHVIRLMVTADSFTHSFMNQLRWMQSTRRSRPWGHLGTGLTFAMPFGIIGFLCEIILGNWLAGALLLALAVINRIIQCACVLKALGDEHILGSSLLYPLRDLLGSILWICSYLPSDSRYHGKKLRIMTDGRLAPMDDRD